MDFHSNGSEEGFNEDNQPTEDLIIVDDVETEVFNAKRERVKDFNDKYFNFDTSDSSLREATVNTFFRDEIQVDKVLKTHERFDGKEAIKSHLCLRNVKRTATSFTCLDCGMNQNAMICSECFDVSKHKGHRVMKINRSGICDCGDINMWKKEGNCSKHSGSSC